MDELRERHSSQILALSKKIVRLKEEIKIQDLNIDNSLKENLKERNEEI